MTGLFWTASCWSLAIQSGVTSRQDSGEYIATHRSSVIRSLNRSSIFCGAANGLLGTSLNAGGNGGFGGGGGGGGGASDGFGGSGETFTGAVGVDGLLVTDDGVGVVDPTGSGFTTVVFVRWAKAGHDQDKAIAIPTKTDLTRLTRLAITTTHS
jgi:hypothetical protein